MYPNICRSKLQLELYRASKEYESARRNIRGITYKKKEENIEDLAVFVHVFVSGDSATAIQSMFRGASTRMVNVIIFIFFSYPCYTLPPHARWHT